MPLFQKGSPKQGGRAKGVRNKLAHEFLTDVLADYQEEGKLAIKYMREKRPVEYMKMIASLMPKELEITETKLMQMPEEELDAFIDYTRRQLAERRRLTEQFVRIGNGEGTTSH